MTQFERVNSIDTPTQRWLRAHDACLRGRRMVGKQSIGAYWQTTKVADHLVWIARRLPVSPLYSSANYVLQCDASYIDGRWPVQRVRARLTRLMIAFGVTMPAELL